MSDPPRIWLVWGDGSVVGVWRSKAAAKAAARMRNHNSLLEVEYRLAGPYVLQRGRS